MSEVEYDVEQDLGAFRVRRAPPSTHPADILARIERTRRRRAQRWTPCRGCGTPATTPVCPTCRDWTLLLRWLEAVGT